MSVREGYIVAIVGATGAVGLELIKCLEGKRFPVKQLRLFASAKSVGKTISTFLGDISIEEFSVSEARKCDFVFLAVSGEFSLQYSPLIIEDGGPFVIDNSSAFRYHDEIPLVVSHLHGIHYIKRFHAFSLLCRFLRLMQRSFPRPRN
jgi:aspartate-semialdehyde dehydrogenase